MQQHHLAMDDAIAAPVTTATLPLHLCSPLASHEPSCDGSHGHLHRPPHLTKFAATCGPHISWILPPLRPPHLMELAVDARPLLSSSPDRRTLPPASTTHAGTQPASPWSHCCPPSCSWAHGAAPGLPPVPHEPSLRRTPQRTPPSCRRRRSHLGPRIFSL